MSDLTIGQDLQSSAVTSRFPNGKTAQTDVYWSQVQRQLHHCVHLNLFNIALSLGAMEGISQDCSSLHQYLQFTNSVHWILHHCVHLRLFSIALSSGAMGGLPRLFITTSVHAIHQQCSLDSPLLCSPAPLWRTTSLHHYITVFTAFSLPLGSPSLQGATSGDHNIGESQCSGFFPLLWSSASLYQTSLFITA